MARGQNRAPRQVDMEHEASWPAIHSIVNFAILAGALFFALRKPLLTSLKDRHHQWKKNVDEAEAMRVRVEELLQTTESKMRALQEEVTRIFENARKEAELEKQAILQKAGKEAEKILEEARRMAEAEKSYAEKKLKKEALSRAIEEARMELKSKVGQEEHQRFVSSLIEGAKAHRG